MTIEKMESKTRKRGIITVRQECHYFAKTYTNESLYSIGAGIGKVDHGTVLNSIKRINNFIDTDKSFKREIKDIDGILKYKLLK